MGIRESFDQATDVERYRRNRRFRYLYWFLFFIFSVGVYLFWVFVPETPERFTSIDDHFKYGSIGSDNIERGLPARIINVLPGMFPDYLPDADGESAVEDRGYEAFGFIREPGRERYIGFSSRTVSGVELLGLNCAACHVSEYRVDRNSQPTIVMGMPAHQLDLQGFFRFLFSCVSDSRFNAKTVLQEMRNQAPVGPLDAYVYRQGIERFRVAVLEQKEKLTYWDDFPQSGPGRIDTFGPYKALFFDMPAGEVIGTSDFPSLWNQRIRRGMQLHWDGNNVDVNERNISAAIGAGATEYSLDHDSLARIAEWIDEFQPPQYPRPVDLSLAKEGGNLFVAHCANCHATEGDKTGGVTNIETLKTDANRLNSFSPELVRSMNTLGKGRSWEFKSFSKTNGYANGPLDGIWLRAPYLHNGSVPTLWHLLNPGERPAVFYRGSNLMDWNKVGFVWDERQEDEKLYSVFNTSLPGNGNSGHEYGSELSHAEKQALIEYLKTL